MLCRRLSIMVIALVLYAAVSHVAAYRVVHHAVHRSPVFAAAGIPAGPPGFRAACGVRQYLNSFTSFQFPAPGSPLNPISRLEWPWEQLFLVAKAGVGYRTFDISIEASTTLSVFSRLRSQDSDWENEGSPRQKTTFSSGQAKPRGWTFDVSTTIPLARFYRLKGIAGFRTQQFRFTATGGAQWSIWDDTEGYVPRYSIDLPGPGIEFSQAYKHWYGGGVVASEFDLSALSRFLPSSVRVRVQGDLAYVTGTNHDQHLRRTDFLGRTQDRHTYETTQGHSWHLNLCTAFRVTDRIELEVEGDFMTIKTGGSHHWTAWSDRFIQLFNSNMSWDGASAWSEQKYLSVTGKCFF